MKILFDTSVLVAALVVNHPRHTVCISWLEQAISEAIEGYISTHTLAETYAVLTRLPLSPRIAPELAQRLMTENLRSFKIISLIPEDYRSAIATMVNLNLTGGGIYDALIAQVALKASVDILLTLNPNHFTRLGDEIAYRVQTPQSND